MLTPHDVHHGLADVKRAHRATVLAAAYEAHPERFVRGVSVPYAPPREVWIYPSFGAWPHGHTIDTEVLGSGASPGGGREEMRH